MTFETSDHDALAWTPPHQENEQYGVPTEHTGVPTDILPTADHDGDPYGDEPYEEDIPPLVPGQRQSNEYWHPDDAYTEEGDGDDEARDDTFLPPIFPPDEPPTGGGSEGDNEGEDNGDEGSGDDMAAGIDATLRIPSQRQSTENLEAVEPSDSGTDRDPATDQPEALSPDVEATPLEAAEEPIEPTLEAGTSQNFSFDDGAEEVAHGTGEATIPTDSAAVARAGEDAQITLTTVADASHVITFHNAATGESALVNVAATDIATMQDISEELVGHVMAAAPALGKAGVTLTILGEQNPPDSDVINVGHELRDFLRLQLGDTVSLPYPEDIPRGSDIYVDATTGKVTAYDSTGLKIYPPTD